VLYKKFIFPCLAKKLDREFRGNPTRRIMKSVYEIYSRKEKNYRSLGL